MANNKKKIIGIIIIIVLFITIILSLTFYLIGKDKKEMPVNNQNNTNSPEEKAQINSSDNNFGNISEKTNKVDPNVITIPDSAQSTNTDGKIE